MQRFRRRRSLLEVGVSGPPIVLLGDHGRVSHPVRGDTFLDPDGEALLAELESLAERDDEAEKAVQEIEHRRSE